MSTTNFSTGDLLEYSSKLTTNTKNKLNRRFPEFARCKNQVRCIFVRMVDEERCEVIPCTIKTKSTAAICFDTELLGQKNNILVCIKKSYTIKVKYLSYNSVYHLINPTASVEHIFQIRKNEEKKRLLDKKRKNDLHRKYRNAVISNDHKEIVRVIKELGYEPIEAGLSSSNQKNRYKGSNPKPYQGGRFTPK